MKINNIELSWFRGAAASSVLDTELKNVVVYGPNGSGKSTFCDAIEYTIMNGKIDHLRHEYSGTRQEKGTRNTHTPDGMVSNISIGFEGDIFVNGVIGIDGTPDFTSNPDAILELVQSWKLEQLILRQDEVAKFVEKPKGDKYTALLPLLGLHHYEKAAENLNALRSKVIAQSNFILKKAQISTLEGEAHKYLSSLSEEDVLIKLGELAERYIVGDKPEGRRELTATILESINKSIASITPDITRYTLLTQIIDENLPEKLDTCKNSHNKVVGQIDASLDSRIGILQTSKGWLDKLDKWEGDINCPACGRTIPLADFGGHVARELTSLEELTPLRDDARSAQGALKSALENVRVILANPALSTWIDGVEDVEFKEAIIELSELNLSTWPDEYPSENLPKIERCFPVILRYIRPILDAASPSTKDLINDLGIVRASASIDEILNLRYEVERIENTSRYLTSGESAIKNHIKTRTLQMIDQISGDIESMWGKLHPGEPIEEVKLYIPHDADNSIDICLKFFGVEQPSPRLTLSEGHRNSLGLCIFLGLAQCGNNETHPIFLDDIVSSWDREHRGMLSNILKEGLGNRQILLFTHDREWFHELRTMLSSSDWKFMAIRPWISPDIGLQWSESQYTFDDARSLIDIDPEAAGTNVRKIMDTQLSIIAERLQIELLYKRGDRNDTRMCMEFLEKIISIGRRAFRKKEGTSWPEFTAPLDDWNETHTLLLAWANRSSHTGSLVPNEVRQLIQSCETSLARFKCESCGSYVWSTNNTNRKRLQCNCDDLQWRY